MYKGRYIEKIILSLGLILIFSSSATRSMEGFKYLTDYLFHFGGMFIIIVTLCSLIKRQTIMNNTLKYFTYLYVFFIGFVILSILINQSLETEIYELEKFTLAFLFLGISLALTDVVSEKLIINSLIISSAIIILYFLIEFPISKTVSRGAYSGGFSNPNVFGHLAATFFSASLVAGTSLLKKRSNYVLATIYLLIATGVAYLTTISDSRTAFITLVIVFSIVSINFIYEVLKKRNLLTKKNIMIIVLIAFGGTIMFILIKNPIYAVLESSVLDKFSRQMETGRLTAGRTEGWKSIMEDVSLFGEAAYFENIYWHHAHNSFLQIIISFGWFAGIAYTIFWIGMLIKSVYYYFTEKITNAYALVPLIVIINFFFLSMMGNMSIHISAFLAMSMVAIFSKQSKQKKGPSMFSYMHNRYSRMDRIHSRRMKELK